MAKDPAFLFYPGDWLSGTMYLTYEQKGAYMDLLILQFNCGKFNEAQAKQVLSICFDVAWPMLKQKFILDNGLYFNARLQSEIEKRKAFTESRRNNAKGPKKPKIDTTLVKPKEEAYAEHMEDENENEDEDINIIQNDFENKKSELINLLCQKLGFDGHKFSQQRSTVMAFVNSQVIDEEMYNHFISQFNNYQEYKKLSGEVEHNTTGYFGTQAMAFTNSAWNSENWELKLSNLKEKNKSQTKTKTEQLDEVFSVVANNIIENGHSAV